MKSRDEYIDRLSRQMKEWSAKIDELESRIDTVSAGMRTTYEQRILDLRDKRDILARKIQELRDTTGDAWKTLSAGMDKSLDEFKNALRSAADKFKKKAA